MAEEKPTIAGKGTPPAVTNGVATRTSSLRKTSQSHTINNAGTGQNDVQAASTQEDGKSSISGKAAANPVKRGTKRAVEGAVAPTVMDEAAIKRSLNAAMESDEDAAEDDEDSEGKKTYLAQRDRRRLLRVLTV